ncbi:MAG: FtsX-like permease family protein [Promethearchaeota archaeon]
MAFRLWKKAIKMSMRERKTFIVFTLMYTVLIFMTSFYMEMVINELITEQLSFTSVVPLSVVIFAAIFLTLLYAWIIVRRNRRIWATLKCIGWTKGNVTSLILGYIFFTTLMGLFIMVEFLFHWVAILGYVQAEFIPTAFVAGLPLIRLWAVLYTILIFLVVQFIGYMGARGRITKVRPMLALKRVGQ